MSQTPPSSPETSSATALAKLTVALQKAQSRFEPAIKAKRNNHFGSQYVDLAGVIDATKSALLAEGLTVVQTSTYEQGVMLLHSVLLHVDGAQMTSSYPILPAKPNDPQSLGSAMTYARRYSMMALLGIAPEDDDGHAGSDQLPPPRPAAVGAQPQRSTVKAPGPTASSQPPPAPRPPLTALVLTKKCAEIAKLLGGADAFAPYLNPVKEALRITAVADAPEDLLKTIENALSQIEAAVRAKKPAAQCMPAIIKSISSDGAN